MNSANVFMVSSAGGARPLSRGTVMLLKPPMPGQRLSNDEILNLVAWMTVLATLTDEEILAARRQVEAT